MSASAASAARKLLDGFAAGDIASALDSLDPDVVLTYSSAVPWSGEFHGHSGFTELMTRMAERFEVQILGYDVHEAGPVAVSRIMARFTARRTGETLEMPVVEMYWPRGDRLIRIEPYYGNQTELTRMYNAAV